MCDTPRTNAPNAKLISDARIRAGWTASGEMTNALADALEAAEANIERLERALDYTNHVVRGVDVELLKEANAKINTAQILLNEAKAREAATDVHIQNLEDTIRALTK
jgi:hypothetical protein